MVKFKPHRYQELAIQHILENKEAGLFLDMGMGKTVSTLTALNELMFDEFSVNKVLIIAPLRVARTTWADEIKKWEHLKKFKVSKVIGGVRQRVAALKVKADIYTINRENVMWLVEYLKSDWFFDGLIIDELSSFKNTKTKRFKALRKVKPFLKRVVGLTGTPAPNTYLELFPQLYLLDGGKSLGRSVTGFRDRYFRPLNGKGYIVYEYGLRPGAKEAIEKAISKTCISMQTEDWLEMPEIIYNNVIVELPKKVMNQYKLFEKEKVLELESADVVGVNAAVMFGKLLQFASGAIYDDEKQVQFIHDEKIKALEEVIEEANGQNIIAFYNYKHELDRLKEAFKHLKPRTLDKEQDEKDWGEGRIQLLLAHPASMGHGLNLQSGGRIIVWFSLTCSLELYSQANARLYRQGQKHSVFVHHIISAKTIDELVQEKLKNKNVNQNALLEALKRGE